MADHRNPGTAAGTTVGTAAGPDWTVKAADTVDHVVGLVRDKAVSPVTTVARALVYGALASFVGVMALVLLAVGLVRFIDSYTGDGQVWVAHLITSAIFIFPGLFFLRMAKAKPR